MSPQPEPIRPRTVLWGEGPQGVGTPMVVSLAGYLAALAWDHNIPPVDLLHWIAEEGADEQVPGRGRADWEALWTDLLRKPRASLSGLSRTAEVVAEVVDRLTGRTDASATTILPWAAVVPTKHAFRRVRAWCPACYLEWSQTEPAGAGRTRPTLYEPLLWQFEALDVCAVHNLRLRTTCPSPECGVRRGALSAWAQPGYCGCGAFLGEDRASVVARDGEPTDDELAWGAYVSGALGDFLCAVPAADENLEQADIAAAVQIAVDISHDGTYTPFANAVRMSLGTVSLWKDGRRRPTLPAALRICAVAGFRLPDFLAGRLEVLRASTPPAVVPPVPPAVETHQVHDPVLVLAALEDARDAPVPPSLASVNRQLHISDRQLMRTHPGLCTAIAERHAAWVAERGVTAQAERKRVLLATIATVHATGAYPSRGQLYRRLPSTVSLRDRELETAWKDEVERLGYPRPTLPTRAGRGG